MTEEEIISYVLANKEWIFSGIGVLIISIVATFIFQFMNGKRRYVICVKKSDTDDIRAFKIGWSWSAFLLSYLWTAWKGLYEASAMFFGLIVVFLFHGLVIDYLFNAQISNIIASIIGLLLISTPVLLGLFGNLLVMRKY